MELLAKLSSSDPENISRTLHSLSRLENSCDVLRQAGCLSLLINILHDGFIFKHNPAAEWEQWKKIQSLASQAIHNIGQ